MKQPWPPPALPWIFSLSLSLLGERVELDQHPRSLIPDSLCDLGVEEKKRLLLPPTPPPPSSNAVWDYLGIVILGIVLLHLLFSLCSAATAGGMGMPTRCWSEQRGTPSAQRGWVWWDRELKGCIPPLPRHGFWDARRLHCAEACPGAPASSWGMWGFLQAHLWCWDLTQTHAAR